MSDKDDRGRGRDQRPKETPGRGGGDQTPRSDSDRLQKRGPDDVSRTVPINPRRGRDDGDA